jgi:hypothetical protein
LGEGGGVERRDVDRNVINENKREANDRRICDAIEERMITVGVRIGRSSHVKIEFEKGQWSISGSPVVS